MMLRSCWDPHDSRCHVFLHFGSGYSCVLR